MYWKWRKAEQAGTWEQDYTFCEWFCLHPEPCVIILPWHSLKLFTCLDDLGSDMATYSPLHSHATNFGGFGGVDDANNTRAVVSGSSAIARIGVAINPEGTKVTLFPACHTTFTLPLSTLHILLVPSSTTRWHDSQPMPYLSYTCSHPHLSVG